GASPTANPVSVGKRAMVDRTRTASGRGHVQTTESRAPRPAAMLLAGLTLISLALIAALPTPSHGESFQAIQADIQQKQSAIENLRGREGVLTTDISALSTRIRTLTH